MILVSRALNITTEVANVTSPLVTSNSTFQALKDTNWTFSLPFQMLAILSVLAVIFIFSAILNNYLNYSTKKRLQATRSETKSESRRSQNNELSKLLDSSISPSCTKPS